MELIFDEDEINSVDEKYGIDLENIIDELLFLEDVTDINALDILTTGFGRIESVIKKFPRPESRTYSSLLYYLSENKKALFSDTHDNNQQRLLSLVNILLCSIYNHMCYLVESARPDSRHRATILVFEACPSNLTQIRSRYEALKIKKIAKRNGLNSIVRFGTNINVFKYTCNDCAANYLHFAGHGEGNGDLAFVGNNGRSSFLGYYTFEKYFSGEYINHHPKAQIDNLYLNSCFSEKFAQKIRRSTFIGQLFIHTISHRGVNCDSLACKSSQLFYDVVTKTNSVESGFDYAKGVLAASSDSNECDYADSMVLI